MSFWTYINGTITVSPLGRTQSEKRYILDVVLAHLPQVTGSEGNMNIYVIQKNGYNCFSNCDEFGQWSNLGNISNLGYSSFQLQDEYIIVVDAALRDRKYDSTLKEFSNWICRLSKRIEICDVLVKISGEDKFSIIDNSYEAYTKMFEEPSWCNDTGEPTWAEFLMFDCAKHSKC